MLLVCFSLNTKTTDAKSRRSAQEWWKNKKIISLIKLSDEQLKKFDELNLAYKKKYQELKAEHKKKRLELFSLLEDDYLNRKLIDKQIKMISAVNAKILENRINTKINVRKVLNSEQFVKLLELKPRIMKVSWWRSQEGAKKIKGKPRGVKKKMPEPE